MQWVLDGISKNRRARRANFPFIAKGTFKTIYFAKAMANSNNMLSRYFSNYSHHGVNPKDISDYLLSWGRVTRVDLYWFQLEVGTSQGSLIRKIRPTGVMQAPRIPCPTSSQRGPIRGRDRAGKPASDRASVGGGGAQNPKPPAQCLWARSSELRRTIASAHLQFQL